jgi:hypothetical protein
VFRNVGTKNSCTGESTKRKNTAFTKKGKTFQYRMFQFIVQRQALVLTILDISKKRMDKYSNVHLQFIATNVV